MTPNTISDMFLFINSNFKKFKITKNKKGEIKVTVWKDGKKIRITNEIQLLNIPEWEEPIGMY